LEKTALRLPYLMTFFIRKIKKNCLAPYKMLLTQKNPYNKRTQQTGKRNLTRHAPTTQKVNFVFLPTHIKKKEKNASPHFSTFVCSHKQSHKHRKQKS